ncbi:hypothetical protein JCM11491_006295 [Sporobolomyces phaffii]
MMSQPYPYTASYPSASRSPGRLIKPEPIPLQHQNGTHASGSSSSISSGYRSTSASTASTANTSEPSLSNGGHSHSLPHPNSNNGAAALLQQHQANQHAFRSSSAPYGYVFQNQSGSSYDARPGFESQSRESSASSTRGSEGSNVKTEADYDPFRIKHRRRTSPPQLKILEHHFELNPKPDVTVRKSLAEQLDMTPREVQVWFQNRRAKVKKLKERADRETASSSRDRNSPPSTHYDQSPNPLAASELPIPPNAFPGSQSFASRTIYGQEVISQPRTSPPAVTYPPLQYSPQSHAVASHPSLPQSADPHSLPYGHPGGAYQSTVYTTTVASSTYATNEYLPGSNPLQPPYPLQPHDPYGGRRFSLPAHGADQNGWSNTTMPDPPATSAGFPPYQPPSTSAFASSSLSAPQAPGSIETSQSASYPSFPAYSFAPSLTHNTTYHERRPSHVSESLGYDSSPPSQPPATYSLASSYDVPTSSASYLPSQVPAPTDPFSSFDPLAPVPPPPSNPPLSTTSLLEDPSLLPAGSRLLERRASVAQQHRQSNRLKPYDPNERRSPGGSRSPNSQS